MFECQRLCERCSASATEVNLNTLPALVARVKKNRPKQENLQRPLKLALMDSLVGDATTPGGSSGRPTLPELMIFCLFRKGFQAIEGRATAKLRPDVVARVQAVVGVQ